MPRQRSPEYKPLYFSTTLRNPERMRGFLEALKPFDGRVLTDELTVDIEGELIRRGLYRPLRVSAQVKTAWQDGVSLSDAQVQEVIDDNPQDHKEAGFSHGWPSRFQTHYGLIRTFGFVWYQIGEVIEFSELGNLYIEKDSSANDGYKYDDELAFLSSFVSYQRRNPFIRVKNDNKPLILLMRTIQQLESTPGNTTPGISRQEIPFFNVWPDADYEALANFILSFREQHGLNPSSETVYENCEAILGGWHAIPKLATITKDQPDDILRKFRLTCLISLRGHGRFVSLNTEKSDLINYVLETHSEIHDFTSEREYWDFVAQVDTKLLALALESSERAQAPEVRDARLTDWVTHYGLEAIRHELKLLAKNRASTDELLRLIPEPLRLEFLSSMLIKGADKTSTVVGNYKSDDQGVPISTAPGGKVDIEVYKPGDQVILLEVTMITGRAQVTTEMVPISRHYAEFQGKHSSVSMKFIAPRIHDDASRYARFIKADEDMDIETLSIEEFSEFVTSNH
jgi:hypothetical protein